jgi:GNAT superfamily N-acetyltransferase
VIVLRGVDGGAGSVCRAILDQLPSWFGIPEANDDYVATADTHPGVIAAVDGVDVGITTIRRHFATAAEVHLMAVAPDHHRHGVGRAMLRHVEERLRRDGVEYLQVKTLSPSRPDEGYAKTRRFWLACGFVPLEELPTLWGPANPALQLVKAL